MTGTYRLRVFGALALAAVLVAGPRAVWAQSAGSAAGRPSREEAQRWIAQLESASQQQREQAERQLVEMGPGILEYLPPITPATSAELKLRLGRIRTELERQQAASLTEGSPVTLSGTMKLSEALGALEQQTGNRTLDYRSRFGQPSTDPEVTIEASGRPYLEVLDQLLDQASLTVYPYAGELRTLAFVQRGPNDRPRSAAADYRGAFRIEAVSVAAERNLRSDTMAGMRLTLEFLWEPALVPLTLRQPLEKVQVEGDNGEAIGVDAVGQTLEIPIQATVSGVNLDLPLIPPPRSVQTIARLTGQAVALVPGKTASFEFDNLEQAGGTTQRQAGVSVTLESVRRNGDLYEFRIHLRLDQANPSLQSYLDWASNNEAYLVRDDGTRAEQPSFEKYLEREREVGYAYLFPLEGDLSSYRLVYKSPSMILEVPIPYELHGIPLP